MGGRGSASGFTEYKQYYDKSDAQSGLGDGNGGETDTRVMSLGADEKSSIIKYTGSYYRELNKTLRTRQDKVRDSAKGTFKTDRDNIEAGINSYTLQRPTIFHRSSSASLLGGVTSVDQINAMAGSVVVDHGFTSTTTTYATGGGSFFGDIQYHISTPKGKGIGAFVRPISQHKTEEEFLFNYGSAYKIVNAYKSKSGYVHVNLQYVGRYHYGD